jgi:hypothetical protein
MSEQSSAQPVGAAAQTMKEQATEVMDEVRSQTSSVAHQLKARVGDEARTQNDRLADGLRQMASELERMAADRPDSPARSVVQRIADGGQQAADYLSKHGPEGVLDEVQEFARRRPGAFLATALVSGFVVGRLGKAVMNAASKQPPSQVPQSTPARPAESMTPPATEPMFEPGRASVPQVRA